MGLKQIAAKLRWVVIFATGMAVIGLIVRLVQAIADGRGLEMYRGGRRMLPMLPVAVLITIGVVAIVLLIAAIVGWYQRRYGWGDDDPPRP